MKSLSVDLKLDNLLLGTESFVDIELVHCICTKDTLYTTV